MSTEMSFVGDMDRPGAVGKQGGGGDEGAPAAAGKTFIDVPFPNVDARRLTTSPAAVSLRQSEVHKGGLPLAACL
jgi:hypothetical protein